MAIDRLGLVRRHNPVLRSLDPRCPLSVGNGEIAFIIIAVYTPNRTPDERPVFREVREHGGTFALAGG